ncbi:hypothetical protein CMUS01_04909 [Colletotrichum musicola]|uniref:Uncharacterized protein n=1 Tax=Colletotrichum musicola TaxID=2175873 RepID=A0A8H6NLY6_9PEZI|nr:hypothetical protein CMUS01_04909 [Colletotrichum musicola]
MFVEDQLQMLVTQVIGERRAAQSNDSMSLREEGCCCGAPPRKKAQGRRTGEAEAWSCSRNRGNSGM